MQNKIVERYSDNSEENRLFSDNTHMVEYLTTIHYFDKLLPKSAKVLDACAGTGVYSFWLSDNGFKVTAGDLVKSNVDMIIAKQSNHNQLQEIYQGNILDLSRFKDNSFDVVLCMGALYHLENEIDREKAIYECLRVLKVNGILAFTYINAAGLLAYNCKNKPIEMERNIAIYNSKFNGMFYRFSFGEENELVKGFPVRKICNIGTSGISYIIENSINSMDGYNFRLWMDYHLSTCEVNSISDYSMFGLYFAQKIE